MTLLVTVFAAIISTILWYQKENRKELRLGTLSLMYWGASIMWFVDAIFEYAELHAAYFTPDPMDMLNDLFLGLSVVAFGLIIWLVILLIQDPKKIVRNAILNKMDLDDYCRKIKKAHKVRSDFNEFIKELKVKEVL